MAYWLLRAGFTPVLIERAPKFREGGYIIDFWGIGFDVAERMGLISELRETGYTIDRVEFVTASGKRRSSMGANVFQRALGDRYLSIRRGDLARAIYRMVEREVEAIFGDSIAGMRQGEDGVEVTFEGSAPRIFDLVVGADGLHSVVRALLPGLHEQAERYLGYYTASFSTRGYGRRLEHTYLSYAAPGRQISRYALRDDRTAFFCVFESANETAKAVRDVAAQKEILPEVFSQCLDRVAGDRRSAGCLRRSLFRFGQPDHIAELVAGPDWADRRCSILSVAAGRRGFGVCDGRRVHPGPGTRAQRRRSYPRVRRLREPIPALHRAQAEVGARFRVELRAQNCVRTSRPRSGLAPEYDSFGCRLSDASHRDG